MSTVIAFPLSPDGGPARPSGRWRRPELSGPKVVILPVVRIERHADAEAPIEPARGSGEGRRGAFEVIPSDRAS